MPIRHSRGGERGVLPSNSRNKLLGNFPKEGLGPQPKTSIVISTAHLRFCPERGRLLDLMTRAANEYARVANDLAAQISTLSAPAYQRKQAEVTHARTQAQHAQDTLTAHKKELCYFVRR